MKNYLVFFGKSQEFTTCYYDHESPVRDFSTVIKDFDLLESKYFSVDNIDNKEILSRYNFSRQSKKYCLLKLYSFAQATNGNRIAGSIYGVGLLSEKKINLTKENLELLRVTKDNFAKLSLNGLKFNKSNFQEDTDRIWKAVVSNKNGNLLNKLSTSQLEIHENPIPRGYFIKNLLIDPISIEDQINNVDSVYFSEDLDHLKRTQDKWGKVNFELFWKHNNTYTPYNEIEINRKENLIFENDSFTVEKVENTDLQKLKFELSDIKYENGILKQEINTTHRKHNIYRYISSALFITIIILCVVFFFNRDKNKLSTLNTVTSQKNANPNSYTQDEVPLNIFLKDQKAIRRGLEYFKAINFIYSFDVNSSPEDSLLFQEAMSNFQHISIDNHIKLEEVEALCQNKTHQLRSISENKNDALTIKHKVKDINAKMKKQ